MTLNHKVRSSPLCIKFLTARHAWAIRRSREEHGEASGGFRTGPNMCSTLVFLGAIKMKSP